MLMTQGLYGNGFGQVIIRPWADGEPVNDMDTKSDNVISNYQTGLDDVQPWVWKDVMYKIFDITFPLIFRFQDILDRWLR